MDSANCQIISASNMCEGTKTTMACGCIIDHIARNCTPEQKSTCVLTTCHRFINDTCARHDPNVRRKAVQREYEAKRCQLTRDYTAAKEVGDGARMAQLEQEMTEAVRKVMQGNIEINHVAGNHEVQWH